MNEQEIREDERKQAAQMLLKTMETAGRAVQPGLWFAATLLDPSVNTFNSEEEEEED